ncbi:MAG: hypothetical protein KKB31_04925 [Nanoarchaeota archaeon]|nr:hypothetical protein [Nanoarchaeota archaeon]
MEIKEKIEKKIKDKELQLSWLEKSNKKLKKQDEKNLKRNLKVCGM